MFALIIASLCVAPEDHNPLRRLLEVIVPKLLPRFLRGLGQVLALVIALVMLLLAVD